MVLTISACFICLSRYTTRNPREVPDLTTRQLQKSYCYNKFLCFFFFWVAAFILSEAALYETRTAIGTKEKNIWNQRPTGWYLRRGAIQKGDISYQHIRNLLTNEESAKKKRKESHVAEWKNYLLLQTCFKFRKMPKTETTHLKNRHEI